MIDLLIPLLAADGPRDGDVRGPLSIDEFLRRYPAYRKLDRWQIARLLNQLHDESKQVTEPKTPNPKKGDRK